MIRRITVAALVAVAAQLAHSADELSGPFASGNAFLALCAGQDPQWKDEGIRVCAAYILGVSDGVLGGVVRAVAPDSAQAAEAAIKAHLGYCIARNVSVGDLRDLVVRYLEAHPESREDSPAALILRAFDEAFLCQL